MRRRFVVGAVLAAALAVPAFVRAHEGHPHKIMGTVSGRHGNHLDVKATDGKTASVTLNEKTKILRGRTRVDADGIKAGERIVVTAVETKDKGGKTTTIATEVRLPPADPAR